MKTAIQIKMALLILLAVLSFSCGNKWRGSAADTTGTNGATNGTGEVPKSNSVHTYNTK